MKLRFAATSPYARKVAMVVHEAGIADRIEIVVTDVWSPTTDIGDDNPLGKVPALMLEDGTTLYDSPVICEYLDSLGGGQLFPPPGPARWRALTLQALADGICDAAVQRLLESRRAEGERSPSWMERQRRAIERALDALEASAADLDAGPITIATLAVQAALGYLDLRFAADAWRQGRPVLAAWFAANATRDSFTLTRPPAQ
ncbi:MAG: glutathione S-transferase [Azospirillum sp.]|nr:glutathione S-transferase [Azospirillum sp.]